MTPAARLAATIELLETVEAAPRRPADASASNFFRERRFIGSGDRRAVSDRVWAVLRARRRLTWWLSRAGAVPSPRLMTAALLLLEGWTLDGVGQSFQGGKYGAPRLVESEIEVLAPLEGQALVHPDMPLAVVTEVPDWVLPSLVARFADDTEAEMTAMLAPAPLDLRANALKGTREGALAALEAEGITAEPMRFSPWGMRVDGRRAVTTGPAFQSGLIEIQDEGSQLVAVLTEAAPGMRVVDWCAGAGGKTLAIAAMMDNRGQITACDVSEKRLEGAVRRLRRAGVHNVERHLVVPGDKWAKRRAGAFDRVLVDAPCTGTGTWRRNPEARYRLEPRDLAELVPKQAAILDDAARLARPGGRLIYATCSVLPEENEAQIDAFLARTPGWAVVPLATVWPGGAPPCQGPYLRLTPLRHGTDGFFGAVLQRG